ncbi:MAG: hypothetical protein ACLQM8_13145 [Limisphaerales bacterium]
MGLFTGLSWNHTLVQDADHDTAVPLFDLAVMLQKRVDGVGEILCRGGKTACRRQQRETNESADSSDIHNMF